MLEIDCLFFKCEINLDSAKLDLIHSIYRKIKDCQEIVKRTKEFKNCSSMNNLQDEANLNRHGPLQLVNIQEEQNKHANERQPGNNNIIYMADDRDRAIRDYVVLTS